MQRSHPIPPRLATRFLRWFLRNDLLEEVEGDLEESYQDKLDTSSKFRADLNYWFQVLNYLRPFAISKTQLLPYNNNFTMVRNYIKVGWRNLFRSLGYSFINLGGMALGLCTVILIGLWVYDELSFNDYFTNKSELGQLYRSGNLNDGIFTTSWLPYDLGVELEENYSQYFENVIRTFYPGPAILGTEEESFSENRMVVDPGFVEAFSLEMISGDKTALQDPYSVILSESFAQTIFGDEDPYFKTLSYNNQHDLKVTGVFKDLPYNSSFHDIGFFVPTALNLVDSPWMLEQGYRNNFLNIYVQLNPQHDFADVSDAIREIIFEHVKNDEDFARIHPQLFIHPMEKWHLYGEWDNGVNTGRIRYVKLFGSIGIFILLLACINFMNLSTARSEKRSREVGIRKSIGSGKSQLIIQFMTESCMMVAISFAFGLVLSQLLITPFNQLADKQVSIPWDQPYFWLVSIGFILITGILAGSYPSFYLSSFNPIKILKGTFRVGRNSAMPRKVMVVIQFCVSVILIIGTIVVYQQVQYAKSRPVGYEREGLVMIPMATTEYHMKYDLIRQRLKESGYVSDVAVSMGPVTDIWSSNGGFTWKGRKPNEEGDFATISVSANYGDVVQWKFREGRNFTEGMASDSSGVVMNETAVRLFGMENPVGETITWDHMNESKSYIILGVIEDVINRSPYAPNMPSVYFLDGRGISHMNIRLNPDVSASDGMIAIEEIMSSIIPDVPFTYEFADLAYAQKFVMEERIGRLTTVFAILAIVISCLGLFGLAAFVAEQKTKEIGIRKVVGASVLSLWGYLTREFVILVFIASIISIPLAWLGTDQWLQDYEYRITVGWWVFLVTVIGAIAIALLTVSYQAIRAALQNPVNSLRSE